MNYNLFDQSPYIIGEKNRNTHDDTQYNMKYYKNEF